MTVEIAGPRTRTVHEPIHPSAEALSDGPGVVVVGAGQAGLAVSRELGEARVAHVVLERGRVAQAWRDRWDSFSLVTPNWSVRLPGAPYAGQDPDGFMLRDEVVDYLEAYAVAAQSPVCEGVEVSALERGRDGVFLLQTSLGRVRATSVVVTTGAYQRPHRPAGASTLPSDLLQIDVEEYRNEAELPAGPVLVVGSGQSGCQIAEELRLGGREVFLACGRASWAPRRIADRDLFWWLLETGYLDESPNSLPTAGARLTANVQATGRGGGHDLHYRTLQRMGVALLGHFLGADGRHALFAPDLAASVAWGDEQYRKLTDRVRQLAVERGIPRPEIAAPERFRGEVADRVNLRGFGAVIFAGGFRPDYRSWLHVPGAFDELGYPIHEQGSSTAARGLHFVGVHFLRKRKSSLLIGVGEDAAIVARRIAESEAGATRRAAPSPVRMFGTRR